MLGILIAKQTAQKVWKFFNWACGILAMVLAMIIMNHSKDSQSAYGYTQRSDEIFNPDANAVGGNINPATGESYGSYAPGQGDVSDAMSAMEGESTRVAGTENGNKACAYAVNTALERSTGAPALSASEGGYGVEATTNAIERQPDRFTQVSAQQAMESGQDYIISSNPAWGSSGSHIGVGNGSQVWSNSSGAGEVQQNYSVNSWNKTFSNAKYYVIKSN